jgi:hypothetical protein
MLPSQHTERETRLANLRALAPALGYALRGGNKHDVCHSLYDLGETVSIRAHKAPAIKPDIDAIREVYANLLQAIDSSELYGARSAISEMLDLAGLF